MEIDRYQILGINEGNELMHDEIPMFVNGTAGWNTVALLQTSPCQITNTLLASIEFL